jgi:hypothetical protein
MRTRRSQRVTAAWRLDSLTRLPYFQVNAVHVYCVGGQSFGFGLTPEPEPAPAPICPQIDVSLVEEIEAL